MYREIKGDAGEEKSNFNVQTWIDVRLFADLCRFKKALGGGYTIAEVARWCMEAVHRQIAGNLVDSFVSTTEAVDYLRMEGISVRQLDKDKRSRRRIGDAFILEERYLEEHGSLESLKQKVDTQRILVKEFGSKAAVDKFTEKAMAIFDSLPDNIGESREEKEERMKEFVASVTPKPTTIEEEEKDKIVATDDAGDAQRRAIAAEERAKADKEKMDAFIAGLASRKQAGEAGE